MKTKAIVIVSAVVVAVLAAVVAIKLLPRDIGKPAVKTPGAAVEKPSKTIPENAIAKGSNAGGRRRRAKGTNDVAQVKRKKARIKMVEDYSPKERRLADKLQDASDDNDLGKIRKAVSDIMAQKNPELKKEAIGALGFFGKNAIKDLMAFLSDSNQGVVDSATDTIAQAIDDMEDDESDSKAEFIESILSIKGLCGKDVVERFAGQLESLGASNERLSVQTMVNLIEDKNVEEIVRARMKEAYQYITSEEYTTFEAAEKWYSKKVAEEDAEAAEANVETNSNETKSDETKPDDDSDGDSKSDSTDDNQERAQP